LSGKGLGVHGEDAILSMRCPVYQGANSRSVYFCAGCDLRFSWEGGDNHSTDYPEWAQTQYLAEKRRWRDVAMAAGLTDPYELRHSADQAFGGKGSGGGHMLHAGGLMLLFFPGLGVRVPEGYQLVVGPATNYRYNPGWTVQHGAYAPGYTGELSFNFQVMRQGDYHIYKGQPFASGMLVRDQAPEFSIRANANADAFYLEKAKMLKQREQRETL